MELNRTLIKEMLELPFSIFEKEIFPKAKHAAKEGGKNKITPVAMMGFSNICKNRCLYCGMNAECKIERYRLSPDEVINLAKKATAQGFRRIFLISGEDSGYGFENLLKIISEIKTTGAHLSLACGEFSAEQYNEIKAAGADEYVLKFEMSSPETFNRLNPSTDFKKRMKAIENIKKSGMKLASADIVNFPGQSIEELTEDIILTNELGISWAPVVPYMPASGTPLSKLGGRGDYFLNLKVISILRLLMPHIDITAQQPGENLKNGFADKEGNKLALNAGANLLFTDIAPEKFAKNFSVIDNRIVLRLRQIEEIASEVGMEIKF